LVVTRYTHQGHWKFDYSNTTPPLQKKKIKKKKRTKHKFLVTLINIENLTAVTLTKIKYTWRRSGFKPLNAELNPICHLLALLGNHHILHVSRIRVKVECHVMIELRMYIL
jgi:transposase